MKRKRVLVTGVGGGIGQSILKALAGSDYTAMAADADPLAAGLFAAECAYLVPRASTPDFLPRIIEICKREKCELIFCGIEPELPAFARAAAELRRQGIIPVVSSPQVVELCDDKLATAQFLAHHGFASPRTVPLAEYDEKTMPLPVVLKPRRGGARSHGVYVVSTARELEFRRSTLDAANTIAQEHLAGDEYTCGALTFEGRCHGVIVMRRTLRDGDTYRAFVVDEPAITGHVKQVAEALQPLGPCNFQLRMKDGRPCIFEINSRCSGTTACRALAGFNEPVMTADYLLAGKAPQFEIKPLVFLRYWNELVTSEERVEQMRNRRELAGDGGRL